MTSRTRDFSFEENALDQLREFAAQRKGLGEGLEPPPFNGPYLKFYKAADKEFATTRTVYKQPRLSYKRFTSYSELPTSRTMHVRGFMEGKRYTELRRTRDGDRMTTRKVHLCTFHSHPAGKARREVEGGGRIDSKNKKSINNDIPTNEDIFDFIKYSHLRHVVVGSSCITVLDKTHNTLRLSLELWKKEESFSHKFARIQRRHPNESNSQHRERYSKIALKSIDLHWPHRAHQIRRQWVGLLKEFGIHVHCIPVIKSGDAMAKSVLRVLRGEQTVEDAARWHGVSVGEVKNWMRVFVSSGEDALQSLNDKPDNLHSE